MKIKGTDYKIKYKTLIVIDDCVCDGGCDFQTKEIAIDENVKEFKLNRVIYHELTHAFLYESGLIEYANNEILVNWIASNIEDIKNKGDKIIKEFKGRKK